MAVMDFARYKEINDQRLNYREMDDASVVSYYRNTGCGDGYRIYLRLDQNQVVSDASYTTTGCGFGVVALAMATEYAKGKSIADLKNLTPEILETLFEFPERRKNYPESAVAALKKAVEDYESGQGVPKEKRVTKTQTMELLTKQGHLRSASLSSVMLEKENLNGVDFSGADLHNAFLQNSSFVGANFSGANLKASFFNGADLRNANFRGADLRFAKLASANIEGADFTDAIYDIGTRVDQKQMYIFDVMKKAGKDLYLQKEEESSV
ncbi:pentapeptide repeat-containing protein [Leptospira sp. 96542]|nr:pentapeptide repeat-containing protein [Leptospira sp. 96542]